MIRLKKLPSDTSLIGQGKSVAKKQSAALVQNLLYLHQTNRQKSSVDFEAKIASARDASFIDSLIGSGKAAVENRKLGVVLRDRVTQSALDAY